MIETNKKRFGGVHTSATQPLKVKAITVDVQPLGRKVTPGSPLVFEATVRNAKNKTVRWEATGGEGAQDGDNSRWLWKAPKLEKGKCRELFTVFAESMTRAGPRKGGEPPRVGHADVWVEAPSKLDIVPGDVRLKPEQEVLFEVVADDLEVKWEVNGGKIKRSSNQSMLYQAPKEEGGPYTVTATVKGQKGDCAKAKANVLVREVDQTCSVQASWQGEGVGGTVNWDPEVHSGYEGFRISYKQVVIETGQFNLEARFDRPIEPQSPGGYSGIATSFAVTDAPYGGGSGTLFFPRAQSELLLSLRQVPVRLNITLWNAAEIAGSISAGPFEGTPEGPAAPKERHSEGVLVSKWASVSASATFSASGNITPPNSTEARCHNPWLKAIPGQ